MKRRIAIPLENGMLSPHFGHARKFAIVDADASSIQGEQLLTPPPHEHGVLPVWLAEKGVTDVIAGGMGQGAKVLLSKHNIKVFTGIPQKTPSELVTDLLNDKLVEGAGQCDH